MKSKPKTKDALSSRFEQSAGLLKQRLIGRSIGEFGTGKTHFWLTAPGPIVVMSFDQGLEGVALEEFGKKKIYPIEFEWEPDGETSQEEAVELRNKFEEDFIYALKNVGSGTVLIDKEDDVWELYRYAQFGAPNDAPRNYPALNQRYRKMVNLAKKYDANVGFVGGYKDEWKTIRTKKSSGETVEKGAATGNRVAKGFNDLEGLVHINFTHRRDDGHFHIDIGKARGPAATEVQDETFEDMTFPQIASLVFPETDESDWQGE